MLEFIIEIAAVAAISWTIGEIWYRKQVKKICLDNEQSIEPKKSS